MILAAIVILLVISLAIFGMDRFGLRSGYAWFLAVGGSLVALILIVISHPVEPILIPLLDWESNGLLAASPELLLDKYSWPFALTITVLLIAALLTDIARVQEIEATAWSSSLGITAVGLLAVLSANPLTLVMTWSLLDLTETIIRFEQVSGSEARERVVISFSTRVVGIFLVLSAIIRAQILGTTLDFSNIPVQVSGYLILAAGSRLGVLPPQTPFLQEKPARRGFGTLVRLVPVAASMVLLTRVANVGVSQDWLLPIQIAAAVAMIYGVLTWVWAKDELDGRPFWILSFSAFSIIAAARTMPFASQSWGLSLIFSGGLLFLYSYRLRRFLWLPILGILGFFALPFTPAWYGLSIFADWNLLFSISFIFGLAILILGYYRHMVRPIDVGADIERWVGIVYPIGLVILPLAHFWLIWSLGGIITPDGFLSTFEWWMGFVVLGLIALLFYLNRIRGYAWSPKVRQGLGRAISLDWLYQTLWWIYRFLGKLISYFVSLLEGEGGVLWAMLIVILLVTILAARMGGP